MSKVGRSRTMADALSPFARGLLAGLFLLSSGCSKGCKAQPYVPYTIGDEVAGDRDDAGAALASTATSLSQSAAKELTLDGTLYRAPEGGALRAALSDDVNLDGKRDAIFIVEKDKRMYFAQFVNGAFQEFASELSVPITSAALCDVTASIMSLGGGAFVGDLRSACGSSEADKPNRHIGVFVATRGSPSPKAAVHLGLSENREQPAMSVSVESLDVDGDGTRDVRVTMKPNVSPGEGTVLRPEAIPAASLVWFDRPTGFSPSLSEPESSLRASLDALRARPNDSGSVAGGEALRLLYGSLCGTRPRLLVPRARCDAAVARVLAETEVFIGSAYSSQKNVVLALATLERADAEQLLPAGPLREQLASAIRSKAPVLPAKGSRIFELPSGCATAASPSVGPLTYQANGQVHLQGTEGAFDFDAGSGDKAPGSEKPGAVDPSLLSNKQERLLEVYDPCDGRSLRATILNTAGDASRDLVLPVGGAVAGCGRDTKRSVRLLGQDGGSFHLLVAGVPLGLDASFAKAESLRAPKPTSGSNGGARSPNGALVATPTALGIHVQAVAGSRLWSNPSLPPYRDICQCTVRNDGKQVACATPQKVYVVEP